MRILCHPGNTIPVDALLQDATGRFRTAVTTALTEAGFEFTEDLPNLQLADEVVKVLRPSLWETHSAECEELCRYLEQAGDRGILVDFGRDPLLAHSGPTRFRALPALPATAPEPYLVLG